MSDLDDTLAGITEMRTAAAAPDRRSSVSAWSVHQHIDHLVLAGTNRASTILRAGGGTPVAQGLTWTGRIVLLSGWIPRGRAQAPPAVAAAAAPERLADRVDELASLVASLRPLLPDMAADTRRWAHPVLGGLTRRQWLRFLAVHQRHHLAICRDIP